MKNALSKAFTLLELLIAMALSSFVMMGIISLSQGVVRYLEHTRSTMNISRKVCLVFNQLERDISSAFIPDIQQVVEYQDKKNDEIQIANESQKADIDNNEKKKNEDQKIKKQKNTFFISNIDDQVDTKNIDGKKMQLFSYLSFISTNSFQVYGQKKISLVRIIYELVANKMQRNETHQTYRLIRKETLDLENIRGKVDEYTQPTVDKIVRQHVLADDIQGMYIEYVAKNKDLKNNENNQKKKEDNQKSNEQKEYVTKIWANRPETQGIVPMYAQIWLDIWNEKKTNSSRFHGLFSVMSYPSVDESAIKKKQNVSKAATKKKTEDQKDVSGSDVEKTVPTLDVKKV